MFAIAPPVSQQVRLQVRRGEHLAPTANLAPGYVQANLAILPETLAADFLLFCLRNPRACPLIGVADVGSPYIKTLGQDLDLRSDLPRYRVWRDGELHEEPSDIHHLWRDDLVSFAIGCSFSFEEALLADGIDIRHISSGCNVPMYRSNIQTSPAGPFSGPMVVSMRPMKAADAIRAIQITSRFPGVHGAPVHLGDARQIGINNLDSPDYGDPVELRTGEIPVFWACGVTPQAVIAASRPAFCITHAPGHMLVTDILSAHQSVF
ncbi:MAG: putative hydro-lyase [Pseudomonas sp.]|uniref:putative hydro-lyase n=1 Tax=Pseudomonas sp. TaxID=306 RepID=UPI003982B0C0